MDDYVLTENIDTLKFFGYQFSGKLENIIGIEDFADLERLYVWADGMAKIDLNQNKKLISLTIHSDLQEIDLSQNTNLERLDLWGNNLTEIDISDLKQLASLDIRKNSLSKIVVSHNENLMQLWSQDNLLACIQVNEEQLNDIPEDWRKDDTVPYKLNCN